MTVRPISVSLNAGNAGGIARYLLDEASGPQAFAFDGDGQPIVPPGGVRANSFWVGSEVTLGALGLERGAEVTFGDMVAALEGRHAQTGTQVRRGRFTKEAGRVVAAVELTFGLPKSVSLAWFQAGPEQRAAIEQWAFKGAHRTLEYLTKTQKVVRERRGKQRISEAAQGFAASMSLHVMSRPAKEDGFETPHLHVHCALLAVQGSSGRVVSPDSWPLFRRDVPLEGGAVFRAVVADDFVQGGYRVRSDTGKKARFFELADVPEGLCVAMSPRTREVLTRQEEIEADRGAPMTGGSVGVLALETRQRKLAPTAAAETVERCRARCEEWEFGLDEAAALTDGPKGYTASLEERKREAFEAIEAAVRLQGPTLSGGLTRATAIAAAAGRMSFEDMHAFISELERAGELLAVRGPRAPRVTTRSIRKLEQQVLKDVLAVARRTGVPVSERARAAGIASANASFEDGAELDGKQLDAVQKLTDGAGWVALTGLAGTGKGETLHAIAAAYRADGWQVIPCAMDASTATQLAAHLRIGVDAYTMQQIEAQLERGGLAFDERTLILVDEATKLSTQHWALVSWLATEQGSRVLAVGHTGQLDGVELPGMFAEMLRQKDIPVAVLGDIHRHRSSWLREHQIAVNRGRGTDAVRILRRERAIKLFDTRAEAAQAMVADWDGWREQYSVDQAILIVHGSNDDVDDVNVLAQQCRMQKSQLGDLGIQAVDRSYKIYEEDVVILRGGAYDFDPLPDGSRARRVVNGQIGIVDTVDLERDVVWVSIREPGHKQRLVEFELGRLRLEHAEEAARLAAGGKPTKWRPPTLRLAYASHPFTNMGRTVDGDAVLWHPTGGKEGGYVAESRSRHQHWLYAARSDLVAEGGTLADVKAKGSDEPFYKELARQLATTRRRLASIRYDLNPSARINVRFPEATPLPEIPLRGSRAPLAERHAVEVADPLASLRQLLGDRRCDKLDESARKHAALVARWDEPRLVHERDVAATAFESLPAVTLSLEREQRFIENRSQDALQQAEELTREAGKRTRRRERRDRDDLLAAAQAQRDSVARDHAELGRLGRELRQARSENGDPEQWVESNRDRIGLWAAIERELGIREAVKELDQVDVDRLATPGQDQESEIDIDGPELDL